MGLSFLFNLDFSLFGMLRNFFLAIDSKSSQEVSGGGDI
jgi:hypothetical protein